MSEPPAPSFQYPEETYLIRGETVRIVCTDGVLDGKPRIDGHRVAVHYVYAKHERGRSVAELRDGIYSKLSEAEIRAALRYAEENPDVLQDVARIEKAEWEQISEQSSDGGGV
jgi:uncharacterized protein (DUF433 family)